MKDPGCLDQLTVQEREARFQLTDYVCFHCLADLRETDLTLFCNSYHPEEVDHLYVALCMRCKEKACYKMYYRRR